MSERRGQPTEAWELVSCSERGYEETRRMKVPGGWLYRHRTQLGIQLAESMVFVPRSVAMDVEVEP